MAATDRDAFTALMRAALALPIAVVPAKAAAAEMGGGWPPTGTGNNELGFTLLGYKERGLMKVTEPVLWGRARFADTWEVAASAAVDIITGASPQVVSNVSGTPVQVLTGASVSERRNTGDVKLTRRFGDFSLSASRALSKEHDYRSKAFGLEGRWELNGKNTTLLAGYGKSNDRIGSHDNPSLDEPRVTEEYLGGITQVISPTAIVESTVVAARGRGWYNDPYKFTTTFFDVGPPALMPDTRPDHRDTLSWLTRYRRHFPGANASLQADYRFYRDDWGIRAHTLEVGWEQALNERWSLRPALRYYTQEAADFYSPTIPRARPDVLSSDQRLGAWGGLSPSMRAIMRSDGGLTIEATLGYVYNARNLHLGGSGSEAFETLRAWYGIVGVSHTF